ncbi:MAG: quinone oxidoreductase [Chloroflexota bacterium]
MKAVRFHELGGPEVLRYEDIPTPTPGEGQVLVRHEAVGVNFKDTYERSGAYKVALPFTTGGEAGGVVEAVGSGVSSIKKGQRIVYQGTGGAYADYATVAATKVMPVPDGLDVKLATASFLQGLTAHYLCTSTFPLQAGQTCLVHAGAGGVGLLLTQMAKLRGATVITTVSTAEKEALSRAAGADHVIRYTEVDFLPEVERITGGAGLPVVYDSVGKDTFDRSLDCLAPRGYLVLFGQSSGRVAPVDPQTLNAKGSLFLTRPTLGSYTATADELRWRSLELFGWMRDGKLNVRIGLELPLAKAAEAHRALEGRQTTGKVVLVP